VGAVREVELRRRRIAAVFERAQRVGGAGDPTEFQADYARYLCVLISGFVERALAEIILAYAQTKAAQPLRAYLEATLRRLANVDKERLLMLIGSLDARWREELELFVVDQRQAALNSVVGLRNDIAHGGGGSLSLGQVSKYWVSIQEIVDKVEELILTEPKMRRQ